MGLLNVENPRISEFAYSQIARVLHWISALIILCVVMPLGVAISYFEPADETIKFKFYNFHESFGIVILVLTLMRLMYRWIEPAPPLPNETPSTIRVMARTSHVFLYLLLLLMPTIGFLATNAWGFPLVLFDFILFPSPIGKDEEIAKWLSALHWTGAVTISIIIAIHVCGGLYHRFVKRDFLSRRMY
jgi:cytochrome b561